MNGQTPETGCCPEFKHTPWDEKVFEWRDKKFIKDSVFTIFHIPINFGSVIRRMNKKIEAASADVPDWLCLSDHTSKWNMDLYVAVELASYKQSRAVGHRAYGGYAGHAVQS